VHLVLVHGFRPQVNEQLLAKGHASVFSHGMRVTDPVALDCAQEAAGQLRFEIEAAFSQGLPNTPMANSTVRVISGNFLTARPVGIVDGVDFMHSGVVRKVDATAIRRAMDIGALVLLSPFGFSPTGEAFNLSMEDVATEVAIALQAGQAAVHDGDPGIRESDDPDSPIDTEIALPMPSACWPRCRGRCSPPTRLLPAALRAACRGGVERSHICPSRWTARCWEVFTHDGIGTMVVDEKLESLREATSTTWAAS
jgi:amino-acid N-acetyltransferase